ncbi:MAG: SEC-C domain-containing protein [Dehalococcoidia bacterium]|nr:SEC-C domain-containing protein [Dehalococcoidia bacterium]
MTEERIKFEMLCPCGSGKKYKYCCGREDLSSITRLGIFS